MTVAGPEMVTAGAGVMRLCAAINAPMAFLMLRP